MTDVPIAVGLRLEYQIGAVVSVPAPRVSWRTETAEPAWIQGEAELEWTSRGQTVWHRHNGQDSVLVAWPFAELTEADTGRLRVRVTGRDGRQGPWSEPVVVTAGFLDEGSWRAQFVTQAQPDERAQPFWARTEFIVRPGLRSAMLYATAQGVYQAEVNGAAVDPQILKPGWTPYASRLIHESTDVTGLLTAGANAIGLSVAGGWYTEVYGFRAGAKAVYGEQPAVAAQLVLRYDDGTTEVVITDESWVSRASNIVSSGIYEGEVVDAGRALADWSSPAADLAGWRPVALRPVSVVPSARTSPVVTEIERIPVAEVLRSRDGAVLLDFGQNLVGRLEVTVSGLAGHTITLRHAEVLDDGELALRPLRRATSTDRYRLAGTGTETWQPQFTFHGFRYAEISDWPGEFDPSSVRAVVIHSDLQRTGTFESSNELVNRFHDSVVWGMRGNFLYLPTDCPQRDERLGWAGDIQVFTPTASFLYECNGFLASWMVDLALEQSAAGGVPFIVPNVLDSAGLPTAAWGDAATIIPWTLYERFGDVGVLQAQYASMRSWVDQVLELAGSRRLWEGSFQFGDWLDPTAPADRPADARTDPDLVASAYAYRSTRILSQTAAVLGDDDTAQRYGRIADEVRQAWNTEYVTAGGRILSDSQTAYALAVVFDLLPESMIPIAGQRLAELVRQGGYHIATGFVGTPLILDALTLTGHHTAASRLMLQTEMPSWLYQITMGATTVWERWDSLLPDGSVNPGEMTSFNHYALGAVADWLHRVLGGLGAASPGYRRIRIAPTPLPGFDHASASHETPYGRATSSWRAHDGVVQVEATIPPNTTAEIVLPDGTVHEVGSGVHGWRVADPRPPAPRAVPVTLDTPLSQIIDDPRAYAVVLGAIGAVDPAIAESFRSSTRWVDGQSLATSTIDTPHAVFESVTAALTEFNAQQRG